MYIGYEKVYLLTLWAVTINLRKQPKTVLARQISFIGSRCCGKNATLYNEYAIQVIQFLPKLQFLIFPKSHVYL